MTHEAMPTKIRVSRHPNWLIDKANNGTKIQLMPTPTYMRARARLIFLVNQLAIAVVVTTPLPKHMPVAMTKNEP